MLKHINKLYALIPARWDSSRFPGKPLANILGLPMVEHVYKRALKIEALEKAYVVTDDEKIAKTVREFKGEVILTSPHHHSGTDRLAEASEKLHLNDDDIVINVQGDQPAFNPLHASLIAKELINDKNLQMATIAVPITKLDDIYNPNHVKVVLDKNNYALYFSRATIPYFREKDEFSLAENNYYKHVGLYAYRVGFLKKFVNLPIGKLEKIEKLEQLRVLEEGEKIKVVIAKGLSPEVDVPEDIFIVEHFLNV